MDEMCSIELADMIGYKISNNKGFRYIFFIIDTFSNYLLCILLKNENNQAKTNKFSSFLTTSERKPFKIESDRGAEFHISIFQNF